MAELKIRCHHENLYSHKAYDVKENKNKEEILVLSQKISKCQDCGLQWGESFEQSEKK